MGDALLTKDELLASAAELLGEPAGSVGVDENLIELGLDSIRLMGLTSRLRKRGFEVSFAELAERPTLNDWWDLLGERGAVQAERPEAVADPAGHELSEPFPLALMQHAYWIGRDEGQALGEVAAHLYVEFDGREIDPDRLARAAEALFRRHPMLRVAVQDDGTQRILDERPGAPIEVHDLRGLPDAEAQTELERLRDGLSHQRQAIDQGRVIDLRLSLLPGGGARLHLDVDMVAADAMSYRVLLSDLARLYEDPDVRLAPIGYSYPRYLADRPAARGAAHQRDRAWWAERLDDLPGAPELPVPADAARRPLDRVVRKHHWLAPEDKQRLIRRAHSEGVTPAMALAAVFAEVIGGWAARPRFLLNLPLFNREPLHPDVDLLVGDFTGSVMLEVDLTEELPFGQRARALQTRLHTAGAHADYSGVEVLRDLSRARGEQVLAPIVYTSALNLGELFDDGVRRSFGEPVWIISQGPQVLLDAQVTEVTGGLLLNWDVRDAAFPEGVVDAMFDAYRKAITHLGEPDADWDGPLPITAPAAQLRTRHRLNASEPPTPRTLHEGFFAQAARTPGAPAVRWATDGTLTYGELADRALRVAAHLTAQGVRPGDSVSIELPKGPDQAIAVLGTLAAGAVYVPIGVEQPTTRRNRIRHTADVRAALVPAPTQPAEAQAATASVEASGESLIEVPIGVAAAHPAPLDAPVPVEPEDVAYLLFTSGSTGEPKGVEVPHRAAMNTIDDLIERFALGPEDASLAVSALDFDLSVFDLFALWSVGGAVVFIAEDDRKDATIWAELVQRWSVTVVNCVPSVLEMLLRAGRGDGWAASMRLVLLGGDWVGTHLPALLAGQAPGCRFVALGGTTETAIHSTVCEVTEVPEGWRAVPYGTPLRGVACRVVDEHGRDRPDWVAGELWIGGHGVACGYRGDPERTADRFVEHQGLRWYRTGDMGRYWPDGTIEFLGRRDHQVKVRGFRIELAEVEAALQSHPDVTRAVAFVTGGAHPRLAAAVITAQAAPDAILDTARTLLPPHMVPEAVVPVAEPPLTANGKVDRRALAALVEKAAGAAETAHVEPRTALERLVAAILGEVVDADRVSAHSDFFALGGDSVLATAFVARLREALDTGDISVRTIFAQRTVEKIARHLTETGTPPGRLEAVAEIYLEVSALSEEELTARLSG